MTGRLLGLGALPRPERFKRALGRLRGCSPLDHREVATLS